MHVYEVLSEVVPAILEIICAIWVENPRPAPAPRAIPEDNWKVPDAAEIARICGGTHDGD